MSRRARNRRDKRQPIPDFDRQLAHHVKLARRRACSSADRVAKIELE